MSKTTPLHVHHAFLYISLPSLHDYDVKMPIFTFCWGRKHKATTFFFFFWTSIQSFRIQLQKRLARLTKWMRESRLDRVWSSATSLFKWRFGSRHRRFCLSSLFWFPRWLPCYDCWRSARIVIMTMLMNMVMMITMTWLSDETYRSV